MYNRYVRNDDGVYARQSQPQSEPQPHTSAPPPPPPTQEPPRPQVEHKQHPKPGGQLSFLSGILDKLHLGDIDIGDLLLLLLLFHLFREDGDEELLIAIGLLLIL